LDINKDKNKLIFQNGIDSLEFVELIGDMDLSYSVNYVKRDLYLKNFGEKLFTSVKQKKIKKDKIRIKIKYDTAYISKANKNKINLFLRKLLNLNIEINFNFLKFDYQYYDTYKADNKEIEVLSQDEIDKLLTAINIDNNKIEVLSQDEIDELLTPIETE